MKDQNSIEDCESKQEKWNRGLDIFIESVIKPDASLRDCARNQKCYHELMDVKLKLFFISTSNVVAGVILYPIGYTIGNIYGVAMAYVIITIVFTYISLHFFRDLIRMIEREKHIHNS